MKRSQSTNQPSPALHDNLLTTLQTRFEKHLHRHKGVKWADVQSRLETNPQALSVLSEMERTGGEPDVVSFARKSDDVLFVDCSKETPKGRVSVCYDAEALQARKEHKPKHSAVGMAEEIGIELLTEEEYRHLQTFEEFDLKTSSWVKTPDDIRDLGGALFCDRRYGHVFVYHNGAQSYYAARGFRGKLKL